MTTRGQKRSNETSTANASDNGTVLDMLTNNSTLHNSSLEERTQTDPAFAKDVTNGRKDGPALAKDQLPENNQRKDPNRDQSKPLTDEESIWRLKSQ